MGPRALGVIPTSLSALFTGNSEIDDETVGETATRKRCAVETGY